MRSVGADSVDHEFVAPDVGLDHGRGVQLLTGVDLADDPLGGGDDLLRRRARPHVLRTRAGRRLDDDGRAAPFPPRRQQVVRRLGHSMRNMAHPGRPKRIGHLRLVAAHRGGRGIVAGQAERRGQLVGDDDAVAFQAGHDPTDLVAREIRHDGLKIVVVRQPGQVAMIVACLLRLVLTGLQVHAGHATTAELAHQECARRVPVNDEGHPGVSRYAVHGIR